MVGDISPYITTVAIYIYIYIRERGKDSGIIYKNRIWTNPDEDKDFPSVYAEHYHHLE